jgi:hypothetical protein
VHIKKLNDNKVGKNEILSPNANPSPLPPNAYLTQVVWKFKIMSPWAFEYNPYY